MRARRIASRLPGRRLVGALAFASVVGLLLPYLVVAAGARADEIGATIAPDREAREAIRVFAKAWRRKDVASRVKAVRTLGRCVHPKVADRLLRFAHRGTEEDLEATRAREILRRKDREDPCFEELVGDHGRNGARRRARGGTGMRRPPAS